MDFNFGTKQELSYLKMAKNYEEFRKHGKQMVDYICDYVKTMDQRPVAPTIDPGYLVPLLADEMPKKAESYGDVMDDFEKKIMPGILHWNHPNFFAYFGAGNAYPSVLGDMLSSGIAAIGFSWVRKEIKKKMVNRKAMKTFSRKTKL